jgi:maltose O-acetyltransferase
MSLLDFALNMARGLRVKFDQIRRERRWEYLRSQGMRLGDDVWLPDSTWIDPDYCFLISIGDHCGFGGECLILAHDAQMDEFLDAGRIGRVIIHESCHIGARTTILPGVEIGPRTIVGANSLVSRSLPPNTVCVGNPARVVCTLDEYLAKHRSQIAESPTFLYKNISLPKEMRDRMISATKNGDAYVTGGRSAELSGVGGTPRTPPYRIVNNQ